MGNPNARPKRSSVVSSGNRSSVLSSSSKGSPVSPKTIPKKKGSVSTETIEPFPPANDVQSTKATDQAEGDVVINTKRDSAEVEARPELRFKSWKTGTLITHNGEPAHLAGLSFKPLPPPPTIKSPLSPTSPVFVPAIPQRLQGPANTATYPPAATSVEKIRNMFANRHPTPPDSPSPFHAGQHANHNRVNSVPPTKSPSTAITIPSPRDGSPLPVKAPRTFLARADRERKDVVIKSTGVTRNVVRITERYLPNGLQYRNFAEDFKPENYDLIKDLESMNEKDRIEFWNKQNVEIIVDFRGEETKGNVHNGKKEDKVSKGKELVKVAEKDGIADMMELLGADFAAHTKHIFITMYFPTMNGAVAPKPTNDTEAAHTLPKKLPATVAVTQAIFDQLHNFSSMEKLEINLRTPANSKTPLSIDALDHLIPFYDLSFTGWEVRWQTDYMSRSEPVKGWPISYLDREYNKILWEREKKAKSVQEAVFVRKSVAHLARPRDGSVGPAAGGR